MNELEKNFFILASGYKFKSNQNSPYFNYSSNYIDYESTNILAFKKLLLFILMGDVLSPLLNSKKGSTFFYSSL